MRTLVITRELPPIGGGAGHVALQLARALAAQGHHLFVVTMHFGNLPLFEQQDNLSIYRVRCGRKNQDSSYLLEMLRFVIAATSLAKKIGQNERCHIIHAHAIVPDGIVAWAVHRHTGRPFVLTAHGSDVPGYNPDQFRISHILINPLWNHVVYSAKTLVTPSEHLARLIRKVRAGISIETIPNGISTNIFRDRCKTSAFLIVSRLVRRKNYHLFLQALHQIDEPQTIHIVGEGPMMPELKSIAGDLSKHTVYFHGWLANESDQWRELYESSRFFVLPSSNENFPISLLEAALADLVILTSDLPGTREALGDDAIYFESLDHSGIVKTISTVLSQQPDELKEMTRRAKARVCETFSWEQISTKYVELFSRILATGPTELADTKYK